MKALTNLLKWDLVLIYKYGIVAVALSIAGLYSLAFLFTNTAGLEKVVALLIFTDPVMYGFLFTSLIVLYEKDARTHEVLAISPLPIKHYIWSKTIAFSLLAMVCSTGIILASHPGIFNPVFFVLAVILSAGLFVFIAITGVSFVQNFNQFILLMPVVLAPVCLPFLDYFNLVHSWLFYLIPTQACLILFEASVSEPVFWKLIYALSYLTLWNIIAYYLAIKAYKKRILKTSRDE